MKYHEPAQGTYESGLTARLMYNQVDSLIRRHTTKEDIERTREKFGNLLFWGKLWDKPEIRSELEEFVMSYLTENLQPPLPGFEEIFVREGSDVEINKEKLGLYTTRLEEEYGSRDQANVAVSELFDRIKKRGKRLHEETHKMIYLKKGKKLIMDNAHDAFAQIFFIYFSMDAEMRRIEIALQS